MASKKEIKELLAEAERQGWRVEKSPGGHWKLYAPNGRDLVVLPSTPSSSRTLANIVARMRRSGFIWKGR